MNKTIPLFLMSFLLLSACTKANKSEYNNAFALIGCEKIDKPQTGFSKMKLTVQNNSTFTMGCYAYIKIKQNGTIIETKSCVFSSLKPSEKQIEEAWFTSFKKHSEYTQAEITLSWNVDSFNYQKEYIR